MCAKALALWAVPLVTLTLLGTHEQARAQDIHHYVAVVSGLSTTMQEKQLLSALANADEHGEYTVDRNTGEVGVKTQNSMDRVRFDLLIGRYGMGIVRFEEVGAPQRPPVSGPRPQRMADMPLYIDTGDPVRDNQRYDAYKAAWIAVHPEQYQELTAPVDPMPTSETDQ